MLASMDADTLTIIGTVPGVGLALAGLSIRTAARQDRRMDRFEDATSAHRDRFETAVAAHRAEMHRIAERQSHVEGRLDERGSAADWLIKAAPRSSRRGRGRRRGPAGPAAPQTAFRLR